MRVLLVSCLFIALGYAWPFDTYDQMQSDGLDSETKAMLNKQKHILHLLDGVFDPITDEEIKKIAQEYSPGEHPENYEHFEYVEHLMEHYTSNDEHILLKKGHLFTLFDEHHRGGMIDILKMFLTAKNWEAFYKSACWARMHTNEGQFVYALSVAVSHRKDLQGIKLPAPYEINPQLYVPAHIIHEAYAAKMREEPIVIDMGFTGTKKNPEQRVAYFGEDFGLNAHHYHWHIDFPFWWREEFGEHIDRKGELFFYMHHQLTARFDAERLSNHLPVTLPLDWEHPIEEGFSPKTTYRKEGEFPSRPDNMHFQDLPFLTVRDMINFEFRIRDAIAHGYTYMRHGDKIDLNNTAGINVLGAMIEASEYSPDQIFFGSLHNYGHLMLGRVTDPIGKFGLPPSVMEHFETATRDPAFFRLHKYIDNLFKEHKDFLPPYTAEKLHMDGVKVGAIEILDVERSDHPNELVTFFDDFVLDLAHILEHSKSDKNIQIQAKAHRLNHDSFKYKIHVNSDKAKKAGVRIFIAPKYDSNHEKFELDEQRWMAIEMDKFVVDLKAGENTIERKSEDASVSVDEFQTIAEILEETEDALAMKKSHKFDKHHRHCGIPQRLLLPKGDKKGVEFDLYVIVTDFIGDHDGFHGSHSYCGRLGAEYPDHYAMGFPFDRKIPDDHVFKQDNIGHTVVTIKHDGYHPSH